jgi:hypothetical protein
MSSRESIRDRREMVASLGKYRSADGKSSLGQSTGFTTRPYAAVPGDRESAVFDKSRCKRTLTAYAYRSRGAAFNSTLGET